MKKEVLNFLSALEGYHSTLKMLHWSTERHSEHILTDDIDSSILKYEDKISEVAMGALDTRFGIGDLKCMLPQSKDLKSVLKELKTDVNDFRDVAEEKKMNGLVNILDDFTEDINTWEYLRTLK